MKLIAIIFAIIIVIALVYSFTMDTKNPKSLQKFENSRIGGNIILYLGVAGAICFLILSIFGAGGPLENMVR